MNSAQFSSCRLLTAVCLLGLAIHVCQAAAVTARNVTTALDSPAGLTFSACTNGITKTTFTDSNIGHATWSDSKDDYVYTQGTVRPVVGSNFLQMTGTDSPMPYEDRARRIKSEFTFDVAGAGSLTFSHRVMTVGGDNDDILVIYDNDITDPLGEYSDEGIDKKDEDGYYSTFDDDFWFEDEDIELETNRYFRTVHVALLAPYRGPRITDDYGDSYYEGYDGGEYITPDTKDLDVPKYTYNAFLDNLVWEPDNDLLVCRFSPDTNTSFAGNGLNVTIDTDYTDDDGNPIFEYRYTLDGSRPTQSSALYDDEVGIRITETCDLHVAAYENGRLVDDTYTAHYVLRDPPATPYCTFQAQEPFENTAAIGFTVKDSPVPLSYYYTTDGATPSLDSQSSSSGRVSAPCTLKVRAYDDGTWSETCTVTLKPAAPPTCTFTADGFPSQNGIFEESATIGFDTSAGMVYYQINGTTLPYKSPISLTEDTTVTAILQPRNTLSEIPSGATYFLNSLPSTYSVRKVSACSGSWMDDQFTHPGWNLIGMTKLFSASHGRALAEWLTPYEFNPQTKSFDRARELLPGNAYWVYSASGAAPANGRPAAFQELPDVVPDLPAYNATWCLQSEGAQFLYNGTRYVPTTDDTAPGWGKRAE